MTLEVFVNTNTAMEEMSWWVALGQLLSAVLRRLALVNEDYSFLIDGLKSVKSVNDRGQVYYNELFPSKPAMLGKVLEWFRDGRNPEEEMQKSLLSKPIISLVSSHKISQNEVVSECPNCHKVVVGDHKYPFDCNNPCPYCGYTGGKCNG